MPEFNSFNTSNIKKMIPYITTSIILASLNLIGSFLTSRSGLPWFPAYSFSRLIVVAMLQVILYTILFVLLSFLFKHKIKSTESCAESDTDAGFDPGAATGSNSGAATGSNSFSFSKLLNSKFICFIALLICWLPALLAYYPGIYSYDAEVQLEQWIFGRFNIHHPLIHTLIMGFFYEYGGLVFYSILQMLLLAFSINKGYCLLIKLSISKWLKTAYILFFGLFPFFPIMSVCMTKDVMFASFNMWLIVLLIEFIVVKENITTKKLMEYVIICILMMLFRNNGVYAILVLAVGLMFYKNRPKKLLISTIGCIAAYYAIISIMTSFTGAEHGEKKEMLSIPLMQLARTYQSHSEEMSKEDLDEIYYYLPQTGCANYRPLLSDPVKMHFDEDHYRENPSGFWKCYLKNLKNHPDSYIIAALYLTMGNWCPEDISHIYVYADWWRDRVNYVMTDAIPVFSDDYLKKQPVAPVLTSYYELFATDVIQYKIPLFRELFIPATYNLILLFVLYQSIRKRKWDMFIVALPVFAYLGTCLLGPGVVTRYSLPLMLTVVLLLFVLMQQLTKRPS